MLIFFNVFISELCYLQKFFLVILFKFNKNLQVCFYYTILLLSLTISSILKDCQ